MNIHIDNKKIKNTDVAQSIMTYKGAPWYSGSIMPVAAKNIPHHRTAKPDAIYIHNKFPNAKNKIEPKLLRLLIVMLALVSVFSILCLGVNFLKLLIPASFPTHSTSHPSLFARVRTPSRSCGLHPALRRDSPVAC